jgi:uncharacterized membrane protein (UPF0127 family)
MNAIILSKFLRNRHVFSSCLITLLLTLAACQKKNPENAGNNQPISETQSNTSTLTLAPHLASMQSGRFQTPEGKSLTAILAITASEHERGLSAVKPQEWPVDHAMFFASLEDNYRTFWMPDTYFDLDIFFLDKDLKIVAIERKVAHHPGRENESTIARTRSYLCRHVLEMSSDSSLSLSLNVGDKLSWMESISLEQTISNTLQQK